MTSHEQHKAEYYGWRIVKNNKDRIYSFDLF